MDVVMWIFSAAVVIILGLINLTLVEIRDELRKRQT